MKSVTYKQKIARFAPTLVALTAVLAKLAFPNPVRAYVPTPKLDFSALGFTYTDMGGLVTAVVKLLIGAVGVGFLIFFLMGALKYVTSGGDKKAVMAAQGTITNALIGLVLAAALFAIMSLLESVFGVKFLNVSI